MRPAVIAFPPPGLMTIVADNDNSGDLSQPQINKAPKYVIEKKNNDRRWLPVFDVVSAHIELEILAADGIEFFITHYRVFELQCNWVP